MVSWSLLRQCIGEVPSKFLFVVSHLINRQLAKLQNRPLHYDVNGISTKELRNSLTSLVSFKCNCVQIILFLTLSLFATSQDRVKCYDLYI